MLVDKVVFGLLIVLAGFVLNAILDRNRAEMALQNEIARVRVEKAAEVWGALDRQQLLTESLPPLFRASDCGFVRYLEFDRVRRQLAHGHAEFRRLLATNRFWLGDPLHAELSAYRQRQAALVSFLQQKRRNRETVIYTVLVNVSRMRALGGRPPKPPPQLLPAPPWSAADVRKINLALGSRLGQAVCAPAFTPAESSLLGQIVQGLASDRQDVAEVMERLVD